MKAPVDIAIVAKESLQGDSRVLAAYLLGSSVNGTLRFDSDIDLGLLLQSGHTMSGLELHDLTADLTVQLGRPVDIGLISQRNLIYARECFLTGKQILCRDVFQTGLTEATLLGMMMQLAYERREIVHAYSA